MSDKVKQLTAADFSATVASGTVLVDFWAPWCGPCKALAPVLDRVADKVAGQAVVAKVNVDEEAPLAAQFSVRSIPTLIVFKNGEAVKTLIGMQQEAALVELLTTA